MRRRSEEAGFTLIEVLIASSLMLVILGAVLTSFNGFANTSRRNGILNEQQDSVRNSLDQIVRQARNLANPTTFSQNSTATTIAVATDDKVSFQTTDPSKQWVSYCMSPLSGPAGNEHSQIWYETSAVPGLTPEQVSDASNPNDDAHNMGYGCPSVNPNWQKRVQIADFVTNLVGSRALFTYYASGSTTPMVTQPSGIALTDTPTITRMIVNIFLDVDRLNPPGETLLRSGAYMRNQNQAPSALFTAKAGTSGQFTFDAGDSTDPEQRTLAYDWYSAPTTTTVPTKLSDLPSCASTTIKFPDPPKAGNDWTCIGTGVVLPYTFNTTTLPRYVFLRVTDPGQLQVMSRTPLTGCPLLADRTEAQCLKAVGPTT